MTMILECSFVVATQDNPISMIKVRVLSINFGIILIYFGHIQSIQSSMFFYVVIICADLFDTLDVIKVVD